VCVNAALEFNVLDYDVIVPPTYTDNVPPYGRTAPYAVWTGFEPPWRT